MEEFTVFSYTHDKFFEVESIHYTDGVPDQVDFVDDGVTKFDAYSPRYGYIRRGECKLFKYIEKIDETPEKNKIYAGSSILKIIQYQHNGEATETIDYIRYFPKIASYGLSKNPEYRLFQYADEIEVIGTLQQDKHLLGDTDEN